MFSLKSMVGRKYGIEIDNTSEDFIKHNNSNKSQVIDQGITKYIYSTLRSGTSVKFDGNIVIIGDVNPGAEVWLREIS